MTDVNLLCRKVSVLEYSNAFKLSLMPVFQVTAQEALERFFSMNPTLSLPGLLFL